MKSENRSENRKIYFILTTCLLSHKFEERRAEYTCAIQSLLQELQKLHHFKIDPFVYIVENNGARHTFLNDFEKLSTSEIPIQIIYTNHNQIHTSNKGLKELLDVAFLLQQIPHLSDHDMIVKLTGRYRVGAECTFLHTLYRDYDKYDAFIRSGAFMYPSQRLCERDPYDCLTGIFGVRAGIIRNNVDFYLKQLRDYEWIEWVIMMMIQTNVCNERIYLFDYLGVWIKTAYMSEYQLF